MVGGSAPAWAQGEVVTFSVIGDVPYAESELVDLQNHMDDHDFYSPSDFLVHVGDIKNQAEPCVESHYVDVADTLKTLFVPAFIVPGDNEWNDCPDPDQAWVYWETHFQNLEQNFCGTPPVEAQGVRYENFAFLHKGVLFVGINLVGGSVHDQSEWNTRMQQDADWVDQQFVTHGGSVRAAVVFGHAGPDPKRDLFFNQFEASSAAFGKPVLFAMGDGHSFVFDNPFGPSNMMRLQVPRGAGNPPLEVSVTMDAQDPWIVVQDPWGSQPFNKPPCVDAGPDATISLGDTLILDGLVADDGVPTTGPPLSSGWSASGPGSVSFGDPSSPNTTASFSSEGTYTLTLSADDGDEVGSDVLSVQVGSSGPALTIDDVSLNEGDSGSVTAIFSVTLVSGSGPAFVDYATSNGTADAGVDYQPESGSLSFSGSTTTRTISVLVNGDTLEESDETFFVELFNPSGASLARSQGIGTIRNDDTATPPVEYSLFTGATGMGSVTLDPSGGTYPEGTPVSVRAIPDPDWIFVDWSGDLGGSTNPQTLVMDADKGVTANFTESGPSGTLTFGPTDDSLVRSTSPDVNYGDADHLRAKTDSSIFQSFLKFDVGGVTGQVQSARLRLFVVDESVSGGSIHEVSNDSPGTGTPWDELSITYSSAPLIEDAALDSLDSVDIDTWVEFDVTAAVSGNGPVSFGIQSLSHNSVRYSSKEGSNPPQLVVIASDVGSELPLADFSGSPTSGDAPLTVAFNDLSSGSPTAWSWSFGDAGTSSAQNPSHTYTEPGTYTVALSVQNASGSDALTRTDYIAVGTAPVPVTADFSGTPTAGAAPLTVDFTDLSSGNPTSWLWQFGDGATSTAQSPSHTYANPGSYDVRLTVQNATSSDFLERSAYVSVSAPPAPVADFSGTPRTGTAPLAVDFTDLSSGNPTSWLWQFGDGATSSAQHPSHTYASSGSFTVTLSASNANGGDDEVKVAYVVVGEPGAVQTFAPIHDARVRSTSPDANYGAESPLRAKLDSTEYRSFLKFALSGVGGAVQSARLRMFVTDGSSDGGQIYSVSNDYLGTSTAWDELGITWNNAPDLGGALLASAGAVSDGEWVEFDVTAAISGDGIYSFGLGSMGTNSIRYSSKEGADPPQLVVEADTDPTPPTAEFSATPTTGSVPLDVQFSDLSGGAPTAWLWQFGDGGTSTAQHPSHTYASAGTYSVTLTVTNAQGQDSKARVDYIEVTPPEPLVAEFSGTPTSGSRPLVVSFSDQSSGGPTSWLWEFGDGGTSTAQHPSHTYTQAGTYSVRLTVGNGSETSERLRVDFVTVSEPAPIQIFGASDDAQVRSRRPDQNIVSDTLRIKQSTEIYAAFLKFQVNALGGAVQSARLRLYVTDQSDDGGSLYLVSNDYLGTTTPWDENGITYNNAPALGGGALDSAGQVTTGVWVEFDVTAAISGEGIYSFGLASSSSNSVRYSSKEGSFPPELVIETD